MLARAEAADAEEDERHGRDRRGDELPAELQRRESRMAKAMWLTTRNVTPTIAPKPRISRPAKGNGTSADSNLLAKPNGFSPSTVSS